MTMYYTLSGYGSPRDSHRLLMDAIGEYSGDTEKAGALVKSLKTGESGKPYIEGFDQFSISHSGRAWAVLFCDKECGLDIQYEKKSDVTRLAGRWYDPADAEAVGKAAAVSEECGRKEFFRLWARREALVKAIEGTVYDASLPSVSGDIVAADGREFIIKDISLEGGEDIHAAICVRKEEYEDSYGSCGSISGKPHAYSL